MGLSRGRRRRSPRRVVVLGASVAIGLAVSVLGPGAALAADDPSAPPALAATWARAVTASGSGRASVLVVGDSFSEGQGATTRQRRWIDLLAGRIADRYRSISRVGEFVPPWYGVYGTSAGWSSASGGPGTRSEDFGPGGRGLELAAGQTATWSLSSPDGLDVVHTTGPGQGDLVVAVDGAEATTIPTEGERGWTVSTPIKGAAVTSSVAVAATGGGVGLEGVVTYSRVDGRPAGGRTLAVWDSAHTGWTADSFAPGSPTSDGWDNVQPDLVLDELVGGNDFLHDGESPAQVAARLTARIDRYHELASDPTVAVILPWGESATATSGASVPATNDRGVAFTDYIEACERAARAAGAVVIDLSDDIPTVPAADIDTDGLHPSDAGQAAIATALDDALAALVDAASPAASDGPSPLAASGDALATLAGGPGARGGVVGALVAGGVVAAGVAVLAVVLLRRRGG